LHPHYLYRASKLDRKDKCDVCFLNINLFKNEFNSCHQELWYRFSDITFIEIGNLKQLDLFLCKSTTLIRNYITTMDVSENILLEKLIWWWAGSMKPRRSSIDWPTGCVKTQETINREATSRSLQSMTAMYVNRSHEHPSPKLESTPRPQQTSGFNLRLRQHGHMYFVTSIFTTHL
jgi:hypothetical protein